MKKNEYSIYQLATVQLQSLATLISIPRLTCARQQRKDYQPQ